MSALKDFLIIDDNRNDVGHLRAVLHMVLGYDVDIRDAATTGAALDAVQQRSPQLVFTDHLSPTDTAFSTILKLRGIGYDGPIVVVTGHGDPIKRHQLLDAGAVEVVIKDDLDSSAIAATLAKVRERLE
jgi:CheY-like chemotaxis protein